MLRLVPVTPERLASSQTLDLAEFGCEQRGSSRLVAYTFIMARHPKGPAAHVKDGRGHGAAT
ncbi:hypothetical protein ASD64_16630 [Mesorhizobium sp. Root157]|nr:hypothetical protein ASD64_16630 [Mesorhizobium sp. Root157]